MLEQLLNKPYKNLPILEVNSIVKEAIEDNISYDKVIKDMDAESQAYEDSLAIFNFSDNKIIDEPFLGEGEKFAS